MLSLGLLVGVVCIISVSGQGCSDVLANCSTTGPTVCEDRTYAEANCKEYCLLCVDFTLPPFAPCIDLSEDCGQVNCSMSPITNFAKINCRRKCGVCQDTPMETELTRPVIPGQSTAATPKETTGTGPVEMTTERCVDRGLNCTGDSCTTQFGWENCRETCGLCGNDTKFPGASTTTQMPTTTTTTVMMTTTEPLPTGFRCVDLNDNCTQDDCDAPDYTYARVYCVETCMLCNNDTLPGSESPPPATNKPVTTSAPVTTQKPTTAEPATTRAPTTSAPVETPKPSTQAPVTSAPVTTSAPVETPKPSTQKPVTSAPVTTSAPVETPKSSTKAPVTSAPVTTSAPVETPKPTTAAPSPSAGPVLCSTTAELVFVLDASSSVGEKNFQTMLGFTQNVTARLKNEYEKLNVTVVTFSNKPQVAVSFNQDADLSAVLKAEANVTYTHGGTQTDSALELMTQQYNFGNSNEKIAIVITDGASFDPAKTKAQAQLAKDQGVTIFTIAVGDDVNPVETKAISSDPDSRYAYILKTFRGLQAIVDELHVNDCKSTTTQMPTTTVTETEATPSASASIAPQTDAPKTPSPAPVTASIAPQTDAPKTPSAAPATVSAAPKPASTVKQETPIVVTTTTTVQPPKSETLSPVTITTASPNTASPFVTNKPSMIVTTTTEPPSTASPVTVTTAAPVTNAPSTVNTAKPDTLAPSTEAPSTAAPAQVSTQAPSKLPVTTVTSMKPETLAPGTSTTQPPVTTGAPVQISTEAPSKQPVTIIDTLKPGTLAPGTSTTQLPVTTGAPLQMSTEAPSKPPVTIIDTLKPGTLAPSSPTPSQPPVTASPAMVSTSAPVKNSPTTVTTLKPQTLAPSVSTTQAPATASPITVSTQAPSQPPKTTVTTMKPETLAPDTTTTERVTAAPGTISTQAPPKVSPSTANTLKPDTLSPSPTTEQPSTPSPSPISSEAPSKLPSTKLTTQKPDTLAPETTTTTTNVVKTTTEALTTTAAPVKVSTQSPSTMAPITTTTAKPQTEAPITTTAPMSTMKTSTQTPATPAPNTVTTMTPGTLAPTTEKPTNAPTTTEKVTVTNAPTTTEKVTVTNAPTTTEKVTVTNAPTTTEKVIVTNAPTTTEKVTVTNAPTTTEKVTVTNAPTSTEKVTVTNAPTSTEKVTDAPTTTMKPVTSTQAPQTVSTLAPVTQAPTSSAKPQTLVPNTLPTDAPASVTSPSVTTSAAPITTTEPACIAKVADIVFVVDASGSIGQKNFNIVKQFIKDVVNTFDLADNYTRVGLIEFSNAAHIEFKLTDHTNLPDLNKAIDNVTYSSGGTITSEALQLMRGQGFENERPFAPDIGIVITDGVSRDPNITEAQANLAKAQGITMFSIGIGNESSQAELRAIASDKSFVFEVGDFDALQALNRIIANAACGVILQTTVTKPPLVTTTTVPLTTTQLGMTTTPSCIAKVADIVFVVDSSGSIGENNFNIVKQFIKDVVNTFDVDTRYTRVGLVEFSSTANIEFKLTDHTNMTDLELAIDSITYSGGGTVTSDALELMRLQGFDRERPLAPDVAIVITDGLSKYPGVTQAQANLAKADGITLFSIGIGNESVQSELVAIASDRRYVFEVGDFNALKTLDNIIAHTACGVILPETYQNRSTTARPTTPSGCVDIDSNCESYPRDSCTDFEPYARAHCPQTCGFCPGLPIKNPDCKDNINDCDSYGLENICYKPEEYSWVEKNCLASCGFCEDKNNVGIKTTTVATTPTTQAVCEDKVRNCVEYGSENVCTDPVYTSWVKENCRKFCGICYTYQYVTAVPLGKQNCPAWTLPQECKLEYKAGQCCPFPVCPPGYRLAVRRE